MKNRTPIESGPIEVKLLKNNAEKFPFWILESSPPLVASSLPPKAAFDGDYRMGKVPENFAEDIQISRDWYVVRKHNTPGLMDPAPYRHMHLAVILEGQNQNQLIEGFVIINDEGKFAFLELIRPGNTMRRSELESNVRRIVQGRIEYGAVTLSEGESGIGIDASEVDQLFMIHPYEKIIAWQHISANGVLAKPIRSENTAILFTGIMTDEIAVEYSFMEVNRGTIWRCSIDGSKATPPKGLHINEETALFDSEERTAYTTMKALADVFSDQITQYSTSGHGVDFYVTDGKSLCMLAAFIDHCVKDPMKFLGRPSLHILPPRAGNSDTYDIPEQYLGNSVESLNWLWHKTGFSGKYKERMITGNLFAGAFKR